LSLPIKSLLNGSPFYADNLEEDNRHQGYMCPICDGEFIPVIPKKNITKHFRHKIGSAHGEPDGPEHRGMKTAVKTGADVLGYSTDYEVKIFGEENRITDVQINVDFTSRRYMECKGFAVECQCASMAVDEYLERNKNYIDSGYKPIWVLGEHYFDLVRVRKLVTQILEDFGFCYFYIDNQFYKYDGKNNVATSVKQMILHRSGYDEMLVSFNELEQNVEQLTRDKWSLTEELERESSRYEQQRKMSKDLGIQIDTQRQNIRDQGKQLSNVKRENRTLKGRVSQLETELKNALVAETRIEVNEIDVMKPQNHQLPYQGMPFWQVVDLYKFFKAGYKRKSEELQNAEKRLAILSKKDNEIIEMND
jgi:competence CoiA-like predicted nuclease